MNLRDKIGAQVRPLQPDTLNRAQQEALEAWLDYSKIFQHE